MNKTILTIVILIISLLAVSKLRDFIRNNAPEPVPPVPDAVFCTADAMMCPDGSYVGRTGPMCEFVCPPFTATSTATTTATTTINLEIN